MPLLLPACRASAVARLNRLGGVAGFITQVTQAATVYREIFTQVKNSDFEGRYKHLAEIHAAKEWLWSALVKQMI